jgi:hypothetical protein
VTLWNDLPPTTCCGAATKNLAVRNFPAIADLTDAVRAPAVRRAAGRCPAGEPRSSCDLREGERPCYERWRSAIR